MPSPFLSIEEIFLRANVTDALEIGSSMDEIDRVGEGSITPRTVGKMQKLSDARIIQIFHEHQNVKIIQEILKNKQKELENIQIDIQHKVKSLQEKLVLLKDCSSNEDYVTCSEDYKKIKEDFDIINEKKFNLIKNINALKKRQATYSSITDLVSIEFVRIIPYQKDLAIKPVFDSQTPCTIHFSIDTEASRMFSELYLKKDELHPLEHFIFERAFNLLEKMNFFLLPHQAKYLNNVVCVDFFVRDQEMIQKEENGLPKIHTIAIWKKPVMINEQKDYKYELIDPSNTIFSNFLVDLLKQFTDKEVTWRKIPGNVLYGPGQDKTGYNFPLELHKPRDCTDIAVKIAFELNEQQRKIPFPPYNFFEKEADEYEKAAKIMIFTLTNQQKATIHGAQISNPNSREPQKTDTTCRENALKEQVRNYRPSSPKRGQP